MIWAAVLSPEVFLFGLPPSIPGAIPLRTVFSRHFDAEGEDSGGDDLFLTSDEASEGTERDIRLHTGRDTLVFTVSIPAGVENGTLFSFKRPVGDGQEIELLFRVRIAE